MSVSAKVLNTGNMALNLVPRQVRLQRKCPEVVETLQAGSASPPPPPPSTMFSNLMYDLQILSCSYSLDRSKCGRGMAADHD